MSILARQALRIGPDDPDVLALAAFTLGYFGEDINVAIGLIDRCLTLNPSFGAGLALERIAKGLCRSPRSRARTFRDLPAPQPA